MMRQFQQILSLILVALLLGCEADLAPASASLRITPESVTVNFGTVGDETFAFFIVDLIDADTEPIDGVTITASTFFLNIVDENGQLVPGGTPVSVTSDDGGQATFTVKVPIGQDYSDTLLIQSGAVSVSATITGAIPSS